MKVGDRVKLIRDGGYDDVDEGAEGTLVEIDENQYAKPFNYMVEFDCQKNLDPFPCMKNEIKLVKEGKAIKPDHSASAYVKAMNDVLNMLNKQDRTNTSVNAVLFDLESEITGLIREAKKWG